ncbi:MAG: hypothetical protein HY836_01780 [Aquabacterium sp.]|uniref:hypothetical protein n=1 Tax=Aquabacterium sp. TaxID=1872578 RepID=UPI0025C0603B|nr:hypothetical protein [Aquabacterium sp.]MBI5924304.1 hypothetical protein [Aquabacterium sp.]
MNEPSTDTAQPTAAPAAISLYDARPFFEKALQYGVANGLINQAKLDAICVEAPKGMVQIAGYFGSEFLRPELEKARERMINLVSLFLEESCQGDVHRAAEALRDNSLLSRSKGGSDMLKKLIAMPQSSHFGMSERKGFTDDMIPHLAKWTLRPLADYRAELATRRHAADLIEAATWMAAQLDASDDELEEFGAEAEAVIRTALLIEAVGRDALPDWIGFEKTIGVLRRQPMLASDEGIVVPDELPAHLHGAVETVRQSLLADMPRILDANLSPRKLFMQTTAFMGRYFWIEDALAEIDHHERSASNEWRKATQGQTDEDALLTVFLHIAAGSAPKISMTDKSAATLIRKIRKSGLHPERAKAFIQAHAPAALREGYVELWRLFLQEAQPLLLSDAVTSHNDALALLRRECVVLAAS